MAYATERDREPSPLEIQRAPWPAPPLNVFLTSGYDPGVFDLCWDDPTQLAANARFRLHGVNIYRSFDSEYGPYERVSELPVGASFWRDRTDNELIVEEDVTGRFLMYGPGSSGSGHDNPRYVFQTEHTPIVKEASQGVLADYPGDVRVYVDGVQASVLRVYGFSGEVEIDPRCFPEVGTQTLTQAVVPVQGSKVTCTYRRQRSLLRTDLGQRVFYRLTSVGVRADLDPSAVRCEHLVETPLDSTPAIYSFATEKLDYIWQEAIRRNRWILEQGGERVKVFIRKNAGVVCGCVPDWYHKQPQGDCLTCYGTGYVGGYDGPYDIIIAPDDAERRIAQKDLGRTIEHSYEVWTGPSPVLSMRDFLVKLNGDRFSIGAVRNPSARGMWLQQHFTIGHFDEKDIRYKVPMSRPVLPVTEVLPSGPEHEASSEVTDNPSIPAERQLRGRTPAWVNTEY